MDEKGEGNLRGLSTRWWAKDGESHGGEQETKDIFVGPRTGCVGAELRGSYNDTNVND